MDFSQFLTMALAVTALATFAGIGLQRGDRQEQRRKLEEARADITALRDARAEEQKEHALQQTKANTTIAEMKADYDTRIARMKADSDTEIATLKADLDALSRTVTARDELKLVGEKLTLMGTELATHHTQAAEHWLKDEAIWSRLTDWMESQGVPDG